VAKLKITSEEEESMAWTLRDLRAIEKALRAARAQHFLFAYRPRPCEKCGLFPSDHPAVGAGWPPIKRCLPDPPPPPDRPIRGADWTRQHADHGGITERPLPDDPPHMIRRLCECGVQHYGKREAT
jgi:hypothetical protein